MNRVIALLLVLAAPFWVSAAQAAVIDLAAVADTALHSDVPDTATGGGAVMTVLEHPGWKINRGLAQWELPVDIAGANIVSATLKLYVRYLNFPTSYASNTLLDIYQMGESWDETTATWNTRDGANPWAQAGAAAAFSNAFVSGTFASMGYVDEQAYEHRTVELDVTALVQNWADGDDNYGLLITAGNNSINTLFSRETSSEVSGAPMLSIEYDNVEVPLPAVSWLFVGGLVVLFARRRVRAS